MTVLKYSGVGELPSVLVVDGSPPRIYVGKKYHDAKVEERDPSTGDPRTYRVEELDFTGPGDPRYDPLPSGEEIRKKIAERFKEAYDLQHTGSLEEALEMLEKKKFDLVLLSPEISTGDAAGQRVVGSEKVLEKILEKNNRLIIKGQPPSEVMFLTYHPGEKDKGVFPPIPDSFRHAIRLEGYQEIGKPFSMDTLDDVMKSALGGKSRIEQIPRVYSLRRLGSQLSAIEGGGNDTRILEILPEDIDSLFVPVFEDPSRLPSPIVKGVGVRPGAAVGVCYCNPDQAMKSMRDSPGKKIILFVNRVGVNLPFNLTGIGGLLTTSSSGKGSHEASLAEAYGFPCITGISASIQEGNGILKIGGKEVHFGEDMIAMDGGRGHIYFDENIRAGGLRTVESEVLRAAHGDDSARNSLEYHLYGILMFQLSRIISASTRNRRGAPLKVYVNASTPGQIDLALRIGEGFQGEYGKEPTSRSNLISGVGIAKTEQHFNGDDFSYVLRLMLAKDFNLSEESVGAEKKRLVDLETAIFSEMIKRVGPLPLQVRLIDVQFSECRLSEPALGKIKSDLGIGPGDVKAYLEKFGTNPLGLRGIRFGLRYPEVYQGQIEALMYSSLQALQGGSNPNVHFLIPFVNYAQQISIVRRWVDEAKTAIIGNKYPDFSPQTGSMLETPSILFGFKNLGKEIPFAHFGSGDLTQLLFGLDRGSSEQVIGFSSREYGIPFNNPFYALGAEVGFSTREVVTITARKLAKDGVQLGIGSNHMDGLDNVRAVYPYMSYISANSTNIAYVALNIAKVATNELIARGAVGRK